MSIYADNYVVDELTGDVPENAVVLTTDEGNKINWFTQVVGPALLILKKSKLVGELE